MSLVLATLCLERTEISVRSILFINRLKMETLIW